MEIHDYGYLEILEFLNFKIPLKKYRIPNKIFEILKLMYFKTRILEKKQGLWFASPSDLLLWAVRSANIDQKGKLRKAHG